MLVLWRTYANLCFRGVAYHPRANLIGTERLGGNFRTALDPVYDYDNETEWGYPSTRTQRLATVFYCRPYHIDESP